MSEPTRPRLITALPIVVAGLAALVGLLALTRPGQQVQAAEPRATAGFQTVNDLVLAIDLPELKQGERPALRIELIGPDGKVIDKQEPKSPGKQAASLRVAFKRPKGSLNDLKIRLTSGSKTSEVIVGKIMLTKAHETSVSSSTEFFAGSQAAMRCSVAGVKSISENVPLSADVTVTLHDGKTTRTLFTGKTNNDGLADVRFTVPEIPAGTYKVEVLTKSALGEEKLERNVKVQSAPKVLLTTDKPLYQPGQTIHIRALALRAFDLAPAGKAAMTLEVEDGKGNKVYKKTLDTSEYGIVSADFTLADEVNMGDYRIRAILGEHQSEKNVSVKRYVLPKFKTAVKSDKTFYLPKETIKGELQVDYFFGKPVANGTVEVKASTFDVAFKEFQTWKGKTDKNGHVSFEIKLPDYFVGTPLAKGNAIVKLDVKVTDTADHSEAIVRTYPVSDQQIRVSLIPEAGRLVPGMENRVFAAALYPDGTPAQATVDFYIGNKIAGKPFATVKTNDAGLAEVKFTPKNDQFRTGGWGQKNIEMVGGVQQHWLPDYLFDIAIEAKDRKGNKATRVESLTSEPLGENVLLRLDKAIYKGGDTIDVDIRTSAGVPTVYLDVVKSGQVMLTRWLDVKDGKATAKIDLPAAVFGTLEVHAYQVLTNSEIVRDSRVIYSSPAEELKIKVSADKDVYRPGDEGEIRFEVTDTAGKPTAAALGVLIVDEAVYALQDMQPGLEKVYFTLQEQLLKPSVQLNFKPSEGLDQLINRPLVNAERQQVAQVLLTAVKPKPPARWDVNPEQTRRNSLQTKLAQISDGVYTLHYVNGSCLVKDKKTGKWSLRPDLFEEAVKQKRLSEAVLDDGIGGKLTLEAIVKMESGFNAEQLGLKVTTAKLQDMLGAVHWYTQQPRKVNKDGKEVLSTTLIADALKQSGLQAWIGVDAWGKAIEPRPLKKTEKNVVGGAFFDKYTLVSAGPDGKFDTDDDVRYAPVIHHQFVAPVWWMREDARAAKQGQMVWRNQMLGRRFRGMDRLGDFGGKGGMMPPMLPGAPVAKFAAGAGGDFLQREQGKAKFDGGDDKAKDAKAEGKPGQSAGEGGAPAMRLREYFPETMLWKPALITDDRGHATLKIPFADSITTWRLTASGSSKTGMLGGVSAPLRVFQDFFVDLDLPVALTQNDEVAFPVAVYNYLKNEQTVTLELKKDDAFSLVEGEYKRSLTLKAGEVTSVKFRIKAKHVGMMPLQVDARGSKMSDAIKRLIEVLPDGKPIEQVFTDRLKGTVKHTINVPNNAITGATRGYVRIYPGVMSQVVEGMDGMLRMPGGCFEQTSSSAYPNVLVVDYIKKSKQASPALLLKAETYLSAGYQRLLTFERPGGGFDWWGSGPPLVWLSAYGLQEFNDMAKVYPVDRGIITRTQTWLLKQQAADGTWSNIGATHGESITRMGDPKLLLTAYVSWAILDSMPRPAGWQKTAEYAQLKKAITYIREHAPKAENTYILALCANALASWDATDDSTFEVVKKVLKALDGKQEVKKDMDAICFPAGGQSLSYARGDSLTVETTALAVLAMVKNGQFTNSVNKSLTYLIKTKGGHGHWGSTQATILALKALIAGAGSLEHKGTTPFVVLVNGTQVGSGKVTKDNADVMQVFDLKANLKPGDNEVSIEVKGETALMYQVVGRNFVPHTKDEKPVAPISIKMEFDRTKLSTKDMLKAKATMTYNGKTPTYNVIVDLPIPPGFTTDGGEFAEMVQAKKVQKFSVTARQVILYLGDVKEGEKYTFEYTLKPKYPIKAKAPGAVVYEYYTPTNRATSKPVELVVEEKK